MSIVTGSQRNDEGYPDSFRVMLQLSQSADLAPSQVDLSISNNNRSWPNDLIYLSKDELKLNHWHHVSICWSANHNFGTGSIWIDNNDDTKINFIVPSSSLNTSHITRFTPLIVGNYYDGPNVGLTPSMTKFFNQGAANTEGVEYHGAAAGQEIFPTTMTHKPNVDLHEVRIYDKYLTTNERVSGSERGSVSTSDDGLIFYLPPYFTKESLRRQILRTPYFTKQLATENPFNVDLSFGVGGHDLNIENFVRDFANGLYPRCYCLTASVVTADTLYATANEILWERGNHTDYYRARQLLLLPNDNGLFEPSFQLLASGTITSPPVSGSSTDKFVNDLGNLDLSLISLRNMVSTASAAAVQVEDIPGTEGLGFSSEFTGGSDFDPDFMTKGDTPASQYELTVVQRTMDNSSNEIYFFDASNLFYGNRIEPGTFVIEDTALTGSSGAVGIKIKDDFMGNLYRADCNSKQSSWNNVGNVLYDEGIAVIKSSNIPLIGQDQFKISFKGIHNVHTYEVNVLLSPNLFTSSSNPTFVGGKPDKYANTIDQNYVAFSSLLLHDNNLNVITRSTFSQPIVKKIGDKYLVRIKIDY